MKKKVKWTKQQVKQSKREELEAAEKTTETAKKRKHGALEVEEVELFQDDKVRLVLLVEDVDSDHEEADVKEFWGIAVKPGQEAAGREQC